MHVRRLWTRTLVLALGLVLLLGLFVPAVRADTPEFPIFDGYPKKGCYGYVVAGTGMWDGRGNITLEVPGPVVDAWLIWEGVNDVDDPGNPDTTTLIVNGQTIVGHMTDRTRYSTIHADWYQWVADVGPSGYNIVQEGTNTFAVSEWWPLATYRDGSGSPDPRRNGVSLMVIYDRSPCNDPVEIVPFYGSDYVWWKGDPSFDGGPLSMNHVFSFDAAPMDRQAHLLINFAGVDHLATLAGVCRDTAVWAAVGSGTPPDAVAETGYPGTHGVNGGVLAAKNVFNASPPCQQRIADPVVDFSGGYVAPEWSITDLTFQIPAGDEWIAVQIESVSPLNPNAGPSGESGAWTGGILTIPLPPPELSITKSDGRTTAEPGDVLTYTLHYENTGRGPAYDVLITDTLPPDYVSYLSCATAVGSCSATDGQVVFSLGTVDPGASGDVTVVVRLDDAFPVGTTRLTNRAVISTSMPGDDPGNNTAEDVTTVSAHASLQITKADTPDPVEAGALLTYTLSWEIVGNAFVNDTTITDALPAEVTFVSASGGGTYNADRHCVRWNLGTRTPGSQEDLTLVVRVKERLLTDTTFTNRAYLSVSDPGVSPAEAEEPTTVHSSYLPGSIGDTVWHDVNGNGVRDVGEPGIGNVTVDLYVDGNDNGSIDAGDTFVARAVTDENGHYLFQNLITDHYLVTVSDANGALAGMTKTSGTVGVNDNSQPDPYAITLGNGETNLTADFGYTAGGTGGGAAVTIGDLVWRDTNGNAVFEPDQGEVGIRGVTLRLYRDLNGNGTIDASDAAFGTVTTDAEGHYYFRDLPPARYIVDVTDENRVLTFYELTTGNDPAAVDVSDGHDNLDVDFGYRPPAGTAAIGDTVFYDRNDDGVQQGDEPGLADVEVLLYTPGPDGECNTADDVLQARTWTDRDGHYRFDGLPAGVYCVKVVESTLPNSALTLGSHFTNPHGPVNLAAGSEYLDADFGFTAAEIRGTVFEDANGNGVQETGEEGISGASVCLYTAGSTTPLRCVDTDADGHYAFPMLAPGDYTVQLVSWPRGYEPTTPEQVNVTAPAGGFGRADFGLARPAFRLSKAFDVPVGTPVKVEVGDVVTFTIRVENTGGVPLALIPLEDTFDPTYLRFLRADPAADATGAGTLSWNDLTGSGSLAPGQAITVRVVFEALAETDNTTNTATVSGARSAGGQTLPDQSDAVSFSIQAPTAVTMADILAEFDESGAVILTWVTTAEFDNWGFNVYRAEVNDPAQAVRINETLIPGRGQSVIGATYHFVDENVEPGKTYWYWIEDVEIGGKTTWHGPVEVYVPAVIPPGAGGGSRIFVPVILH